MKKIHLYLNKILDYILRRKTLVSIIFLLSVFLIKELGAYSAGDSITNYCNQMLEKHQVGVFFYFFSTIKAIFNSGSIEVIIITVFLIIIVSLLKYFEMTEKKNKTLNLIMITVFSIGLVSFLILLFSKNNTLKKEDKLILIDPLVSMKSISSDDELKPAISEHFYYKDRLTPKELDTTIYNKITKFYQEGKLEESKRLINNTFKLKKDSINDDGYLGYIVASYFALKKYDKAAKMVLNRNKNHKIWDHSLKLDLAKCIRFYSLQNGFVSGFSLIDTLKTLYTKHNIISKLWVVTPYEHLVDIENGKYDPNLLEKIDLISLNNIRFVLSNDSKDPYCSYANYIIGDYDKVLNCGLNNRLDDIIKYSQGYKIIDNMVKDIINNFSIEEGEYIYFNKYNYISKKVISSEKLNIAIKYFKDYIKLYPNGYHINDSLFWIAWIYSQKHQYKSSLKFLNQINYSNNEKNKSRVLKFKSSLYNFLDKTIIKEDINLTYKRLSNSKISNSNYLRSIFKKLDFKSQLNLAKSNKIDNYYLLNELSRIYYDGNLNNFIIWFELIRELKLNKYERKILSHYECEYKSLTIKFEEINYKKYLDRIKSSCSESSAYFTIKYLEKGLNHFKKTKAKESIIYKIVRILVNHNPSRVNEFLDIMKKEIPESNLLDDVYAETVFAYYISIQNEEKGELILNEMIDKYRDKQNNALDNALYWVVIYYFKKGYLNDIYNNSSARVKYRKYRKLFFDLYPNSLEDFSEEDVNEVFNYIF